MKYLQRRNKVINSLTDLDPLKDKLKNTTLNQLIEIWCRNRFEILEGDFNEYYIREWQSRYKENGYHAFICHMDTNSMRTWRAFHDLWCEVNMRLPEDAVYNLKSDYETR